jgi:2,5-dichloro-2,5-cyclohexadiene-1,4-diol dehydrogenase 1
MPMNPTKSIIVTGGASGIGKAAALLLAKEGHRVTIADLAEAGGQETVASINASGSGRAQFVKTDVADPENVRNMVDRAVDAYGHLDGAINAAGIETTGKLLHELSLNEWNRNVGVNLTGMFLCVKFQVAAMLTGNGGSIVAVSSSAALMGMPNSADYCAGKAGVTGIVRSAAVDYASAGIRVNAILPGRTDTPMVQRIKLNIPALTKGSRPVLLDRAARPEEVAAGAVWLISDASSYVTGVCLSIDGGMTIV